jgi:peptidoglycan/LPS O-acetylase OafA/YrhL
MNKKVNFPSLNGLRAISILFVIINHLSYQFHIFKGFEGNLILKPIIDLVSDGQFGVNVFFVISGFLITSLLIEEEKKHGKISWKKFYIRRTLRIFPAYYFLLLVYFVLQMAGLLHISNSSWLTSVTYTKDFTRESDWVTFHAWSLSVEEQFYLLWPIAYSFGNGVRKKAAIFLVLAVPLIRLYTHFHPVSWIGDFSIFVRIDAIATGCLIALYKDAILKVLTPHFRKAFFISIIGIFLVSQLVWIGQQLNLHLAFIIVPFGLTYGTFANLFIGVILLYSVFGPQRVWFKLLNSKVLSYIGMLSYSIYLWQQLFIGGLAYWPMQFPQNIFFVFGMALFSYYVIEKPFLKLKDRLQKSGKQEPQPVLVTDTYTVAEQQTRPDEIGV